MQNPILYIILNGELNMSPGKAAAQAAHAAMLVELSRRHMFISQQRRTVIVLEAANGQQLQNLHTYLDEGDMWSDYYIDEGANEVDPFSVTALVVEPIAYEDKEKRELFQKFPLFGHKKNLFSRLEAMIHD